MQVELQCSHAQLSGITSFANYLTAGNTDFLVWLVQDNGEKFTNLLTAVSSYAEGFSADMIIRRASKLWEKLEARWFDPLSVEAIRHFFMVVVLSV